MKTYEAQLDARNLKMAFVAAKFNSIVVDKLLEGSLAAIRAHGGSVDDQIVVHVPGAFELPYMCQKLAKSKRYDAVVALGTVIKGQTDHYEFVAKEACSGITKSALDSGVPVTLGLLTVENLEQALNRAGGTVGNLGWSATVAAMELANLTRILEL